MTNNRLGISHTHKMKWVCFLDFFVNPWWFVWGTSPLVEHPQTHTHASCLILVISTFLSQFLIHHMPIFSLFRLKSVVSLKLHAVRLQRKVNNAGSGPPVWHTVSKLAQDLRY